MENNHLLLQPRNSIAREVAQVVAHLVWDQRVAGSSPVFPTSKDLEALLQGLSVLIETPFLLSLIP